MSRTRRDILNAKRKRDLAPPDWYWLSREPSWWHQLHTHVPARAQLCGGLRAVLEGTEDQVNLPDHKKPHIYYW